MCVLMPVSMCVLLQVMRMHCSAAFSAPVDLAAFPDYAQDVSSAMDLGTIKVSY